MTMKLKKTVKKGPGVVKISYEDKGAEVGRAYLYLLKNSLHKQPFGLLEDVFVEPKYRGSGLGSKLIWAVVAEAKKRNCYKLIATSRNTKPELKKFYKRFGLNVWGVEFRKDL